MGRISGTVKNNLRSHLSFPLPAPLTCSISESVLYSIRIYPSNTTLTDASGNNALKPGIMTLVTNGQLLPVASLNYSAEQWSPCQLNISLHATKTQDHEDLHSAASLKMHIQSLFLFGC